MTESSDKAEKISAFKRLIQKIQPADAHGPGPAQKRGPGSGVRRCRQPH